MGKFKLELRLRLLTLQKCSHIVCILNNILKHPTNQIAGFELVLELGNTGSTILYVHFRRGNQPQGCSAPRPLNNSHTRIKPLPLLHAIKKTYLPYYSRKYWCELINLAVRYGITLCIYVYASKKFWQILIWLQTAKLPYFSAMVLH